MNAEYTVGQTLWWEGSRYAYTREPGPVTIERVGRRWLTLDNGYRVDRQTLIADGGGYVSPGRCYLSREAREAESALEGAWAALCQRVQRGQMPAGVTIEAIQEASRLLGLGAGGEKK